MRVGKTSLGLNIFLCFVWCTQAWLCERVFIHILVCFCLSCVRLGLQGHLGPWFPAPGWMGSPPLLFGAETEPKEACDVSGERGRERGGDKPRRSCILHPWQRSEVSPFCIHLTAESDRVVEPGLIKMSGFWQLWLGCVYVCLRLEVGQR